MRWTGLVYNFDGFVVIDNLVNGPLIWDIKSYINANNYDWTGCEQIGQTFINSIAFSISVRSQNEAKMLEDLKTKNNYYIHCFRVKIFTEIEVIDQFKKSWLVRSEKHPTCTYKIRYPLEHI